MATGLNALLNYGYAILRAAVARALVAAGLLPALGLFHANRSNAFCLADDLMEPLRPLVDRRVRELHQQGHAELNPQTKAGLLGLLADRVRLGRRARPADGQPAPHDRFAGAVLPGRERPIGDSPGMYLSGYRCMWIVAMFDLPVDTKEARRAYTDFVKFLKRDGFTRMQYSVYCASCPQQGER